MNVIPQLVILVVMVAAARRAAAASALTLTPSAPGCPEIAFGRRCTCWYSDVTCDALGISDLSDVFPLPPDAEKLSASRNKIPEISSGALNGAENLTSLALRENRIQRFDITALVPLATLQNLDLSHNELKEFDLAEVSLPNLQFLDLTGNELFRFQLNPSVSRLRSVALEENQLTDLKDSFPVSNVIERAKLSGNKLGNNLSFLQNLPNVVTLWLSYNNITDLNNVTFASNTKIQFLRVDGNSIMHLYFVEYLSEMMGLNISSTGLSIIPPNTFNNMHSLQYLYLADNKISDVDFLRNTSNKLFSLTLSRNEISKLDSSFFKGKDKLVRLSLDFNYINDVSFIPELRNVERLIINNNNIQVMPKYILSNTKINYLNLSDNNLEDIEFIQHSEHLKDLYLRNNIITHINSHIFRESKIERLDLSSNKLGNLNFVRNMKSLRDIQVQNTSISDIPQDIFLENGDLGKIDLSLNTISNIDFVFYMSKIRHLTLSNCSIESKDDSALKCSRSVEVVTTNKNRTLSFIKSTQELWDECYGSVNHAKWLSVSESNAELLIAFTSQLCLAVLLLIILIETIIRCRRKNKNAYNYLIDNDKKTSLKL